MQGLFTSKQGDSPVVDGSQLSTAWYPSPCVVGVSLCCQSAQTSCDLSFTWAVNRCFFFFLRPCPPPHSLPWLGHSYLTLPLPSSYQWSIIGCLPLARLRQGTLSALSWCLVRDSRWSVGGRWFPTFSKVFVRKGSSQTLLLLLPGVRCNHRGISGESHP